MALFVHQSNIKQQLLLINNGNGTYFSVGLITNHVEL